MHNFPFDDAWERKRAEVMVTGGMAGWGGQEQKWALMKGQCVIDAGAGDERKEVSSDWAECYLTTTEQCEEGCGGGSGGLILDLRWSEERARRG